MIAHTMKDASQIRGPGALGPHGQGSLHQRLARKHAQKPNGVEQVGFAHSIDTGHTCERAEAHVHIHQIFEAIDLQSRKHVIGSLCPGLFDLYVINSKKYTLLIIVNSPYLGRTAFKKALLKLALLLVQPDLPTD
jgi:hypothetical protein